jgi:hypothetical protein
MSKVPLRSLLDQIMILIIYSSRSSSPKIEAEEESDCLWNITRNKILPMFGVHGINYQSPCR